MNTTVHHTPVEVEIPSELDELEDLIPKSSAVEDVFGSLNDLLADAMKSKADALRIKEQRKLLASGKLTGQDAASTQALVRDWELKKEWVPCSDVQMFSAQTCSNCGETHYHFEGIYQRQVHKFSHTISRWIKSDAIANKGLPKEAKCEESFAPVCASCSPCFEDA